MRLRSFAALAASEFSPPDEPPSPARRGEGEHLVAGGVAERLRRLEEEVAELRLLLTSGLGALKGEQAKILSAVLLGQQERRHE